MGHGSDATDPPSSLNKQNRDASHSNKGSPPLPCIFPSRFHPWRTGNGRLGGVKARKFEILFPIGQFCVSEGLAVGHWAISASLTHLIWEIG